MTQVFETEVCRVWTGPIGTALHAIEDAEQHELDVIPFCLQVRLNSQSSTVHGATEQGLYLTKTSGFDSERACIFLPADALSCFSVYSPSPFVSSVLVVLDVDEKWQQGYFFSRVHRAVLTTRAGENTKQTNDQSVELFYDTDMMEELLAALHTAFPKVLLSTSAEKCLAKREMNLQRANGSKLGDMVKRRKTLSAEAFYGSNPVNLASGQPSVPDRSWRSFYEKLQFRVSHSLMCQLEGTAPILASFPRQQEAFEFADQVVAFRRRVNATRCSLSSFGSDLTPRVFSFESAGDGKRRFLVASFAEFWKNYKKTSSKQRHVYEIIREGVPCRLYFDLEFKRDINPNADGASLVSMLVSLLQLELYRRYGINVKDRDIYQLDSSTPAKFSRHLIVSLVGCAFDIGFIKMSNCYIFIFLTVLFLRITFTLEQYEFPFLSVLNLFPDICFFAGQFVREFVSELVFSDASSCGRPDLQPTPFLVNTESVDDPEEKKQLFIDMGVYTRNRMFRVLGSSKFKKEAILHPLNELSPSESELDLNLFMNTLVCPYPSLEAKEQQLKRSRLLRCETSFTASGRSKRFTASGTKSLAVSSVECRRSIYPALDAFICSQATTGGVQGEIRSIQMLMTNNSAMIAALPGQESTPAQPEYTSLATQHPWMITYHMARNRWCANIRRPHKSNNVMFVVDIDQHVFYQKCHDPVCQALDFRSPPRPLPQHIDLSPSSEPERLNYGNT
ncbi:DNA-directed primase/polymerase protein [Phytophthora citrophthora]|uniref:DNA-directed primase/polymerase protein n=1 Tax=Phytophthora citrophthora TaxID=4793 RepID=A0AAD9GYW6_9STRA|nr:DNA-directed primase/polymerase protein [Phytophthora citrophthora]